MPLVFLNPVHLVNPVNNNDVKFFQSNIFENLRMGLDTLWQH